MPVDSSVSQELRVVARQIGGRGLVSDSPLWRTLFPLDHLRIDGRVAVGNSAQYLLASRLNSAKELIAVAWTPVSDADMAALKTLSTFLINKECVTICRSLFFFSSHVTESLFDMNEQPPRIDIPVGLERTRLGPRTLRHSVAEFPHTAGIH